MRIFISYARNDAVAVRQLHRDIGTAGHDAWRDERLEGGQDWWQQMLERISSCALFAFAVSPDSIQSRAGGAELEHAVTLRRPILPVRVRDVDLQSAPDPLPALHVIDYRERTPELANELTAAINRTPESVPLPEIVPEPPRPPYRAFGPPAPARAPPHRCRPGRQAPRVCERLGCTGISGGLQGSRRRLQKAAIVRKRGS
jgi:TIR domain-containing protein